MAESDFRVKKGLQVEGGNLAVEAGNITASGSITGSSIIKSGGTSSQFLKADGSVDSSSYSTTTGTVTSVSVGTGLDVTDGTTTPSITLDLSEFTDMTATMVGTDEFIVLDSGAESRKAASEIGLSIFNNDSGFTTNTGTVTSIATSSPITGGTITGSGTIGLDDPANLTQLTETTDAIDDKILLWDESDSTWKYMTLDDLQDSIDTGIAGSISNTQVAFGTGTDTVGGDADFTFDSTNAVLSVEKIKTQIILEVDNDTASSMSAGSAVYVSGDGTNPSVSLARADSSSTMPSVGIVTNNIGASSSGYVTINGVINISSTLIDDTLSDPGDVGKILYVSPTTAGNMTITKPTTSTHLIQNVGKIVSINGSNVRITVSNIGRTNDVPNTISISGSITGSSITLSSGSSSNFLLGDGSTVATSTYLTTSSASSTYQPLDSTLTGLAALGTSAGIVVDDGDQTFSIITNNSANWNTAYNNMIASASFNTGTGVITLTQQDSGTVTVDIDGRFQESSTELTNLLSTTGTTAGFVKDDGDGTFTIDTSTYLTGNQTVTLSGDVTGSGTTAITTTIAANAVGTDELNVTGTGTTSQFLRSDGDGSFTWATPTDTNTEYTAGTGLALSSTTFSVDLSELTDMTATMVGSDEFIVLDAGADRRKAASEIGLSIFNNDSNFITSSVSSLTSLTTIGPASGTVSVQDNLTVGGNLTISGTTTTIDTTNLYVEDTSITLNRGGSTATSGIDIEGTSAATVAAIRWNSSSSRWEFSNDGSSYQNIPIASEYGTGDITGVTAGTGLSGGGTSGSVTLNVSGLTTSEIAAGSLLISGETFVDTNTQLMSAAAINDRIESFGYTTNTGDITGVTAGTGLSGGGTTGTVTVNFDGNSLSASGTLVGTDNLVVVDGTTSAKTQISTIPLSIFNNDSGFTTNVGDITGVTAGTGLSGGGTSGTVTLNVSGLTTSEIAAGSLLISGETFADNDTSLMTAAAINDRIESFGYTTNTGDITGVTAGTGLSGGGTSGTVSLAVDLSELTTSTTDGDGDFFVVVDSVNAQKKLTKGNIAISGFNNDSGFTTNTGTVTSVGVTAGNGLSGGGTITTSGSVSLALDFSELTDMTTDISGTTEFILQNGTTESRKAASEIKLSAFNNDSGFTTNTGTVTSVGSGTGLTGGAITTSGTLSLDLGAVIASDGANRVLTSDGDGTLTAESNMLFNTAPSGSSGSEVGHLDVDLGSGGNYEPVIRAENTATSAHFLSSPLFAKTKINGAHALIAENNSTGTQGMVVTRAGRLGVRVDPDVSDPTDGYELFVSGDVKARSLTLYGSSPATISVGRWETITKGSGTFSTNLVVRDTGYDPDTTTYMGLPSSGFVSINGGTGISYTISASTDTITLGSAASWSDGQTVVEVLGTNTSYPDRALKVVSGYAGSHSTTDAVRLFDLDGVGTTFVNTISSGSLTGDGTFNILSLDTTSFKAAEAIIHISDGTNAYSSKIFFDSSGNFGEYQVLKDASSIVIDIDVGVTGGSATIKADYTGASSTTLTAKVRVEGVV